MSRCAALDRLGYRVVFFLTSLEQVWRVATRYGPRHRLGRSPGITSSWPGSMDRRSIFMHDLFEPDVGGLDDAPPL